MKVLVLGPHRQAILDAISATGDDCIRTEERIAASDGIVRETEFIVSYGYRHLIRPDVLALFPNRAINLHISYLPFNRGADPNLWSILDQTPNGVTIHHLDAGLDTGRIIEQRTVTLQPTETLRSSYERLSATIERLFEASWPMLRTGKCDGIRQPAGGSVHRLADRAAVEHLLRLGWDTPIVELLGKGQVRREEVAV